MNYSVLYNGRDGRIETAWSIVQSYLQKNYSCFKMMNELQLFVVIYTAGADIKEMEELQFKDVYMGSFLSHWTRVSTFTKPIIAAVNGYAVSLSHCCFSARLHLHNIIHVLFLYFCCHNLLALFSFTFTVVL